MHKLRSGGGGGGGGGIGRRSAAPRAADSAPAVWQSFIAANIALCQLILDELTERQMEDGQGREQRAGGGGGGEDAADGDEDEDEAEQEDEAEAEETIRMLSEQVDALEAVRRRRLPFADRMGVMGMMVELTSDQLPVICQISDAQKAEELQAERVLSSAVTSCVSYGKDSVQRAGGSERSRNRLQQDSEQEALMAMKLLDTLLLGLCDSSASSAFARRALLAVVPDAVSWLLAVATNRSRSDGAREAALSVVSNLLQADDGLLSPQTAEADASSSPPPLAEPVRSSLLSSLVSAAFDLCSDEDEQLSVEAGHVSSQSLGTALLDLQAGSSSSVGSQQSALLCLAVLPSTAPSFCSDRLQQLVDLVTPSLSSSSPVPVRASAFVCIGELLENCDAAFQRFASAWLQLILSALREPGQPLQLQHKLCLPLIQLAAHTPESAAYAPEVADAAVELMVGLKPRLLGLDSATTVSSTPFETKPVWQLAALLAAALEAALSADESSPPSPALVSRVLTDCLPLWLDSGADEEAAWPAKTKITAAVAQLAANRGNADSLMQHKATFECWSQLVPLLREDIVPHLNSLLPSLCSALEPEHARTAAGRDGRRNGRGEAGDDAEEEEDEEGEEEEEEADDEDEETDAITGEQVAALDLYRQLVLYLGSGFLPFHSRLWTLVQQAAADFSPPAQEAVAALVSRLPALFSPACAVGDCAVGADCCQPSHSVSKGAQRFRPGVTVEPPLAEAELLRSARDLLFSLMLFSIDSAAVAAAFDSLSSLLQWTGQWLLTEDERAMAAFTRHVRKTLNGEAICQQGFQQRLPQDIRDRVGQAADEQLDGQQQEDGDEAELQLEDDDDADDDAEDAEDGEGGAEDSDDFLLQQVMDCLVAVAKVRGSGFDSLFSSLFPYVLRAASRARNGYPYGCLAELTAPLPLAERPAWLDTVVARLLSALNQYLQRKRWTAARNAAYATGCLLFAAAAGQEPMREQRLQAAQLLADLIRAVNQQLEQRSTAGSPQGQGEDDELEDVLACRDNAVSALGRLLLTGGDWMRDALSASLLPAFLSGLPLLQDDAELPTACSALVKLSTAFPASFPQQTEPHLPAIAQTLKTMLTLPVVDGESAAASTATAAASSASSSSSLLPLLPAPLPLPARIAQFIAKAAATFFQRAEAAARDDWRRGWTEEEKTTVDEKCRAAATEQQS